MDKYYGKLYELSLERAKQNKKVLKEIKKLLTNCLKCDILYRLSRESEETKTSLQKKSKKF